MGKLFAEPDGCDSLADSDEHESSIARLSRKRVATQCVITRKLKSPVFAVLDGALLATCTYSLLHFREARITTGSSAIRQKNKGKKEKYVVEYCCKPSTGSPSSSDVGGVQR
jgi:hypothetical protein